MRLAVSSVLAAAVLAACHVDLAQAPKRGASAAPRADRSPRAGEAPAARGSASPGAAGSPGVAASPGTAATQLARAQASFPPVAATRLTGLVKLDASYMVAAGAGNLVAAGAGNIVAAGAGNLISDDGSTLISDDGSTLISDDGSTLIGADGGSLIGADGGSLIGADGGSLIGADGGSFQAPGYHAPHLGYHAPRLGFRLAAADALPPGTELPGQGLRVRVYELESGQPVLASRDPAARAKAYVRTDAQGRFSAPVLAGTRGNVLVVADVRGVDDPRLQLTSLARPQAAGAEAAIDEALALVTFYTRMIVFDRLRVYMREAGTNDGTINHGTTPVGQAEADLANQAFGKILTAAKAKGVHTYDDARLDALIGAMQDVILAHMPVREVPINAEWTPEWTGAKDLLAFDTLVDAMKRAHDAAGAKLRADPAYFDAAKDATRAKARPPMEGVEPGQPVGWAAVRKPADVPRFMIKRYVASAESGAFSRIRAAYHDLGMDPEARHQLKVAVDGYLLWVFTRLAFDLAPDDAPGTPGMLTQLVRVIEASDQPGAARPIPPPEPPQP